MLKKRILLIIAQLIILFSYSQEWELLTTNSDGQEIYTRPHSINTAWFKTTPEQIPTDNNKTVEGYGVQLYKFDCRSKKIGLVAYFKYNKEGDVLDSYQIDAILAEMKYAPPETIGEFMINKFCKKDDYKAGDKGQLDGDPYLPSYFGESGSVEGGYALRGRGKPTYSKVVPECDEEGSVVVEIHVNRNGSVVNAVPGKKGTTGALCLYDAAKKTAMTYKWPADSKAPTKQVGFIVINFNVTH